MRKKLPIIPLTISVVVGFGAFISVFGYLNKLKQTDRIALEKKLVEEKLPTYTIVYAKEEIEEFKKIEKKDLEILKLTGEKKPANAFLSLSDVVGKYAQLKIPKGNILQAGNISDKEKAKNITDIIPIGKRAVAIQISDTVLDFINPGDRVDLIADFVSTKKNKQSYSKMILQKVLVLAKGSVIAQDGETGSTISLAGKGNENMLTFALSYKEAESISAILKEQQKLRVVFRSVKDNRRFKTTGTSAKYLLEGTEDLLKHKKKIIF